MTTKEIQIGKKAVQLGGLTPISDVIRAVLRERDGDYLAHDHWGSVAAIAEACGIRRITADPEREPIRRRGSRSSSYNYSGVDVFEVWSDSDWEIQPKAGNLVDWLNQWFTPDALDVVLEILHCMALMERRSTSRMREVLQRSFSNLVDACMLLAWDSSFVDFRTSFPDELDEMLTGVSRLSAVVLDVADWQWECFKSPGLCAAAEWASREGSPDASS